MLSFPSLLLCFSSLSPSSTVYLLFICLCCLYVGGLAHAYLRASLIYLSFDTLDLTYALDFLFEVCLSFFHWDLACPNLPLSSILIFDSYFNPRGIFSYFWISLFLSFPLFRLFSYSD
jgi:hypothetical protein